MQRIKLTVLLMVLLTIAVSCEMEELTITSLTGKWEWVSTEGGFAAHIHDTPASTGKKIQLELRDNNKYFVYTNGQITSEGTYSLSLKKCIHDHSQKQWINFSSDQNMMVERLDSEQLYLSDESYDGIGHLYSRLQGKKTFIGD